MVQNIRVCCLTLVLAVLFCSTVFADESRKDVPSQASQVNFDFGWLGIVGIAGLIGLLGLKKLRDNGNSRNRNRENSGI